MSNLVAQGGHDIGVRRALGVPQRGFVVIVVQRRMELTGAGVVVRLVGASVLTQVLLFGVSTTEPMTFATVPLILIVSAVLAS